MFGFLRRRREGEILEACEAELERTRKASAVMVNTPGQLATRAALLERARSTGVAKSVTFKRLDFLQRLLSGLAAGIEDDAMDPLIAEARALDLADTDGIRRLLDYQRMAALKTGGPKIIERDAQGCGVYLRCEAEHKNKPGRLEVRDDGMTFVGEVVVEIPWSNAAHVAQTTHSYRGIDYRAIAVQEGKRRTPTKFTFTGRDDKYACELIEQVWTRCRSSDTT